MFIDRVLTLRAFLAVMCAVVALIVVDCAQFIPDMFKIRFATQISAQM